ncbi:amphi-Trp domain-containing protein [Halegenticoccus soli]|uniref:amphi-Trp domain-containing protein n=1 Tax=Halegenticoccus soli TaxID=1985678 RepID=UPI000C6E94EA|nr:amphi-Trp domain-containing protein [Halegenticoccus soli]
MAEKTQHKEKLSRKEVATRLEALAQELHKKDEATVTVNNKDVTLSPRKKLNYEITVQERSARLRGKRESISLKIDWKPKK